MKETQLLAKQKNPGTIWDQLMGAEQAGLVPLFIDSDDNRVIFGKPEGEPPIEQRQQDYINAATEFMYGIPILSLTKLEEQGHIKPMPTRH